MAENPTRVVLQRGDEREESLGLIGTNAGPQLEGISAIYYYKWISSIRKSAKLGRGNMGPGAIGERGCFT